MTNLEAEKRLIEASDNFLKLDLSTRELLVTAYRMGHNDGRLEQIDKQLGISPLQNEICGGLKP